MDPEGKAAVEAVDDKPVVDALDEAAATAVANIDKLEEDFDKVIPDEKPPEDADGLPTDNKARSDLGRKFSALHRRQDEYDLKLDKLLDVLTQNQPEPVDDFSTDEPMTKAEAKQYFKQLQKEEKQAENQQQSKYQNKYDDTLVSLSAEYSNDEANAIFGELTALRYDPSGNAAQDAELNFLKAERAFLKKKVAKPVKKDVPLKGDDPTGVITNQKTPAKDSPTIKVSAAGQSYLDFVAKKDGSEKAQSLRKSLNA